LKLLTNAESKFGVKAGPC